MDFSALDVETANSKRSSICQIGISKFRNGLVVDELCLLVNPQTYFDTINVRIHGIDETLVKGLATLEQVWEEIWAFIQDDIIVSHSSFDKTAISRASELYGLELYNNDWLDCTRVVRRVWDRYNKTGYGLKNLAKDFGIKFNHHNALADARTSGQILVKALEDSQSTVADWLTEQYSKRIPSDLISTNEINQMGAFFGQTIVFTGALSISRKDAAKNAANAGFSVTKGVSRKINFLVVGDQDIERLAGHSKSSKHRKVEELILKGYEIKIIGESDFSHMIKN